MARRQTRRSISLSRSTYERMKAYCDLHDLAMSQFVEDRVEEALGDQPEDLLDVPRAAGELP